MNGPRRRSGGLLPLWSYAFAATAFYAVAYLRTRPDDESENISQTVRIASGRTARTANTDEAIRLPRVSVVVPARNEERDIRDCVESLLAQNYPDFRVIAVDDASTDLTPDILQAIRRSNPHGRLLMVVRVEDLPPGWAGKPHALHVGASVADGEWLLFTDADTRHAPGALRYAVERALRDNADLLSLGTAQDLPDFWGRVLMPMAAMGISLMYPPRRVNDPASPIAIANGQYILIRSAIYERLRGYASGRLRGSIVEDRDLAQEAKRAGGRVELLDGRALVRTRMYRSLREQWDGWTKNAYVGSRGGPLFFLLMLAGLPATCILPFVLLLAGVLARRRAWILAGTMPTGAALAYRTWLDRRLGVPWRYAWTHPLAAAVFTGILARSFWRVVSGQGVEWRGRTIRVGEPR